MHSRETSVVISSLHKDPGQWQNTGKARDGSGWSSTGVVDWRQKINAVCTNVFRYNLQSLSEACQFENITPATYLDTPHSTHSVTIYNQSPFYFFLLLVHERITYPPHQLLLNNSQHRLVRFEDLHLKYSSKKMNCTIISNPIITESE